MKSKLTIEQKVWNYLRRNKKFLFSNVLLVTGITAPKLTTLLESYEKKGFIKRNDNSKSLMNSYYIVIQKLESEPRVSKDEIKQASLVLRPLNTLQRKLKDVNQTDFSYLFKSLSLSRGVLKQSLIHLQNLGVISVEDEGRVRATLDNSLLNVNALKLKALEELFKVKEVTKIKEHISSKKILDDFAEFPRELELILETITQNEYLKRDELRKLSGVTRTELKRWWSFLKKSAIIIDSVKDSPNSRVSYILSANRAKRVLAKLKAGAYEEDKELKKLWMQ